MNAPTLQEIDDARRRIAPHVHRTPVVTSSTFDRELGAELFFKCENFQKVGAFKARGAANAVLSMSAESAARGVITHSSGNHAAALAFAAGIRGVPCTVVMPRGAPEIKVRAVRGYGAEVVFCEQSEREEICRKLTLETGKTMVHPFQDPRVIAGQATACAELLEQVERLDVIIAPVGGGGLLAGTAIAAEASNSGVEVWGAEPEAVDDAYRSMKTGIRQPRVEHPVTAADGLLTALGEINFRVLRGLGVRIVTVSEAQLIDAAKFVLQRMKLVIEPSAAAGPAVARAEAKQLAGRRVGVILSGGNTDFSWLD